MVFEETFDIKTATQNFLKTLKGNLVFMPNFGIHPLFFQLDYTIVLGEIQGFLSYICSQTSYVLKNIDISFGDDGAITFDINLDKESFKVSLAEL